MPACNNRLRLRCLCVACQEVSEQRLWVTGASRTSSQLFMILDPQAKLFYSMCKEAASYRQAARAHAIRNTVEEALSKRHSSSSASFAPSTTLPPSEQSGKVEEKCNKTCVGGLRLIFFPLLSLKCFIQSTIIWFPVTGRSNMKSISEAR